MPKHSARKTRAPKPKPAPKKAKSKLFFRHRVLSPKERRRLLPHIRRKLKQRGFFTGLRSVGECSYVRKYEVDGRVLIIKDTSRHRMHSLNYADIRKDVLAHHQALRRGLIKADRYIATVPKAYGRIDKYLVMEYVPEKFPNHPNFSRSLSLARIEMSSNLSRLVKAGLIPDRPPQARDAIVAGHTNPKHPENGKCVFFLPYDYG